MSGPLAEFLEGMPLAPGVRVVLAHASGLMALDKPCDLRSHPNRKGLDRRALLKAPYDPEQECYHWPRPGVGTSRFYLLNRLDAPASRILLGATDEGLSTQIKELFAKRLVKKRYYAPVVGHVGKVERIWRDRLLVARSGGQLRVQTCKNSGQMAETVLLKVQYCRDPNPGHQQCSIVQFEPRTGRTHQLRVQCAARGFPMVGDATYGDFRFNRAWARNTGSKRLYLHSSHISFKYDWKGRQNTFEAESTLPKEFMVLFNFQPSV